MSPQVLTSVGLRISFTSTWRYGDFRREGSLEVRAIAAYWEAEVGESALAGHVTGETNSIEL